MLAPLQDERLDGPRPEHHVDVGGERQQLDDVAGVERAVRLADADEVGVDGLDAGRGGSPTPYPWTGSNTSRADVSAIAGDVSGWALLFTTTMSSTIPSASNAFDARADALGLVVGRQHDRDGSSVPHPSQILPGQPASAVAFGT